MTVRAPRRPGDAGGQTVIVAKTDLGSRDAVILVDDRNDAERKEAIERCRGVEIAPTIFEIGRA